MSVLPTAAAVTAMLAAAAWGDPQRVSSWADSPTAVPSGQIVFEADGAFEAARWTGATFTRPRELLRLPAAVTDPDVGFDARGRIVIAALAHDRVMAGRPLRAISRRRREVGAPEIAVAASGAAIIAWAARTPRGWRVEASMRAPGGRFRPARRVSGTRRDVPSVSVALGDRGHAVVAWHWERGDGSFSGGKHGPLWAAVRGPGGHWTRGRELGGSGHWMDVALAVAPSGRMLAAWIPLRSSDGPDATGLFLAERPAGGGFGPARELAPVAPGAIEDGGPVVAVSDDGGAIVAWSRPTGPSAFGTGLAVLESYTRPAGGDFTASVLTSGQTVPTFPVLAGGRDGALALGWVESPAAAPADQGRLLVSLGSLGSPLPAPATVASDNPVWPTLAITTGGDVLAAWIGGPFGSGPLRAAVHRPGPP